MSDIFLSYAIEDRAKAAKLAAVFEQQRWTVWWDPTRITPGADYAMVMAEELEGAKIVVALWSCATALYPFLTRVALRRRAPLVPVFLEEVELPTECALLGTFDLSDWNGSAAHTGLQDLLRHVRALIAAWSPWIMPSAFMCGYPESETGNNLWPPKRRAAGPPEGGARFTGVFISYRRSEAAAYAGRLYDRLAARFGKERVFLDMENVGYGEDFVEAITAAAESCAVLIVLISREWLRDAGARGEIDDYVRLEVAKALGRKIRVIPILIQGASMPAPKELPEDLSPLVRRNALALSDMRWERDVEDLIKSLENLLNN